MSCSTLTPRKPMIKERLCPVPIYPIFQKINSEDTEETKLEKLLDNILKLKIYTRKLEVAVKCLRGKK